MDLPELSDVRWPAGPSVAIGDTASWVDFKLASAHWYIDTLEKLGHESGHGFGRYRGVEMALDGVLAALCGAVDAAERPLWRQLWTGKARGKEGRPRWGDLKPPLAERPGLLGASGRELRHASERDQNGLALGWLAQLRDLRNRAVHEDSIERYVAVEVGAYPEATVGLSIPGVAQPVEPVTYLRGAADQVRAVTALILAAVVQLGPRPAPSLDRQSATVHAPPAVAVSSAVPATVHTGVASEPVTGSTPTSTQRSDS